MNCSCWCMQKCQFIRPLAESRLQPVHMPSIRFSWNSYRHYSDSFMNARVGATTRNALCGFFWKLPERMPDMGLCVCGFVVEQLLTNSDTFVSLDLNDNSAMIKSVYKARCHTFALAHCESELETAIRRIYPNWNYTGKMEGSPVMWAEHGPYAIFGALHKSTQPNCINMEWIQWLTFNGCCYSLFISHFEPSDNRTRIHLPLA